MEQAHAAFVEEDWERAVELYTEHLATLQDGTEAEVKAVALASRAAAFSKLGMEQQAFEDASRACELKADYEVAAYRKGLAAFGLGRYAEAQASLERGLALRGGEDARTRNYGAWLRKCRLEMDATGEGTVEVKEAPARSSSSSSPAPPVAPPAAPAGLGLAGSVLPLPAVRYQYYQSGTHVTVTLLLQKGLKGLKEEEAAVGIEPRRLTVALKGEGGAVLFDKPLFDAVEPAESSAKFLSTKVEIKLKKASPYQWADLVASSSSASAAPPVAAPLLTAAGAPAAASNGGSKKAPRPYASHRDWEAVEKEITKELEGEKPEGEDALNKLFQDIYQKASDETRRAMVKSFQTSGGTVLSTNWEEVAKKDYEQERTAPDGMEWRKWG